MSNGGGNAIECARFTISRPLHGPQVKGPVVELHKEAPMGQMGRSLHQLAQQEPEDDLRHRSEWDGMGGKRGEVDPGELLA